MKVSKSQLSTKSLRRLAQALPKGAQGQIAEELSIDRAIVSKVLSGKVENQLVIDLAIKIIEERKEEAELLEARINQVLS